MDQTRKFNFANDPKQTVRAIMTSVYDSLKENGYDPVTQIVGYLLSEDPTYITNYKNARSLIRKVDRDELMYEIVCHYLDAER